MTLIFLALICICLPGLSLVEDGFRSDHMSRESAKAVTGIFVLLVFLRHFKTYITPGPADRLFFLFDKGLGQLIVIPFFFFSGYGVMLSIRLKGTLYIRRFPVQRMLRVWYRFALAVLLYAASAPLLGKTYSPRQVLTALTGWNSIGNSNWFMFTVFVLYLITWIFSMLLMQQSSFVPVSSHKPSLVSRTSVFLGCSAAGVFVYMLLMSRLRDTYFYDTAFAWIAGMAFVPGRRRLEAALKKKQQGYVSLLLGGSAALILFSLLKYFRHSIPADICWSLSFSFLLILLLMKIRAGNRALRYLGAHAFEIYILQRLPLAILSAHIQNTYLLFASSAAVTLVLAHVFSYIMGKLDQVLFPAVS